MATHLHVHQYPVYYSSGKPGLNHRYSISTTQLEHISYMLYDESRKTFLNSVTSQSVMILDAPLPGLPGPLLMTNHLG